MSKKDKDEILHEYDAKLDKKGRLTIRKAAFKHYHVKHYSDGVLVFEPRVLVKPSELASLEKEPELKLNMVKK